MSRPILSYLLLALLLFTSLESTLDSVAGEHPHGQGYVHSLDGSYDSAAADSEDNDNHCQHCCHGHTSSLSRQFTLMNCDMANQQFPFYPPHVFNFAQAPPTPPPNA